MTRRVVIVILDGLRRDLAGPATTPHLAAFARTATTFANHHSAFPSTTRVCSATLATGCRPSRHQLAGNTLALVEDDRLVVHDAGHPDFLQHKRRVTGCSLGVPTLAERVKQAGGAIVFSNVSPGAAYAHDPDGHGHVYHRAGSFGPGRYPVPSGDRLAVVSGIDGDQAMTLRFIDEVLHRRKPALSVLWLSEPDITQHAKPLGSPDHLSILAEADRLAGSVIDAVAKRRKAGDDTLLIVGSDHGHQTVTGAVDLDAELVAAGLKAGPDSEDVVVAANGTAALVYLDPAVADREEDIARFLADRPWTGRLIPRDALPDIGQAPLHRLAFAVSMQASESTNAHGVPGTSLVAEPAGTKTVSIGTGQHGGLGTYEQSPVLMVSGQAFDAGALVTTDTSLIDIAPTVLTHLGLPPDGMDGRPLQLPPPT